MDNRLISAASLIKNGTPASAVPILQPLLKEENADAWFLYSFSFVKNEDIVRCLERCLRIDPDNEKAKKRLELHQQQIFNNLTSDLLQTGTTTIVSNTFPLEDSTFAAMSNNFDPQTGILACPRCHRMDKIISIPSLVSSQTANQSGRYIGFRDFGSTYSVNQSALARMLMPPLKPTFKNNTILFTFGVWLGAIILWILLFIAFATEVARNREVGIILIVIMTIAVIGGAVTTTHLYEKEKGKIADAMYKGGIASHKGIMNEWTHSMYCERCNLTYCRTHNDEVVWSPPEQFMAMLWSRHSLQLIK